MHIYAHTRRIHTHTKAILRFCGTKKWPKLAFKPCHITRLPMVARVLILYSVLQPLPVGIWSRADRLLSDLWIVSRAVFDLNVIGKASQTSFCSRQSLSRHRAMAASLELPMKRNWHRLHQSETFFLQKGEISEIWYSAAWRHLSGSVGPDWRFLKVLGDMVSIKSSPKAWLIFGLEWKATFFMLNYCGYFLGNVWKNLGNFFNSASGHSGLDAQ